MASAHNCAQTLAAINLRAPGIHIVNVSVAPKTVKGNLPFWSSGKARHSSRPLTRPLMLKVEELARTFGEIMTIRTYPFLDEHSNCRNPAAVSSIYAAAGLGISTKTLARLRRLGFILAFSVPSRIPGKQMWRYRVEDLLAFSRKQRNHIRAWDPHTDSDLPAIIVSKVLGVSLQDVYIQKHRGRLKDYRPETVRSYLTNNNKREVIREIKQELKSKLSTLRAEVRRLQRLLKSMNCPGCPKGLSE